MSCRLYLTPTLCYRFSLVTHFYIAVCICQSQSPNLSPTSRVCSFSTALLLIFSPRSVTMKVSFLRLLVNDLHLLEQHLVHKVIQFSSVQSLSRVWLFATPWIAACQASLSITSSRSSLRLTSIESKSLAPSYLYNSSTQWVRLGLLFSQCRKLYPREKTGSGVVIW